MIDAKTLKGALYLASATTGPSNTTYTNTGELAATGNYTTGGASVTNGSTAGLTGNTTFWTPSASIVWTSFTSSGPFDALMIYSVTDANRNVSVHTFSSQSIIAGTFTLTMPTNDSTNGLVRLA